TASILAKSPPVDSLPAETSGYFPNAFPRENLPTALTMTQTTHQSNSLLLQFENPTDQPT
ncbi:hypothetical protein J6590_094443, partial [Homalodisca vitripennis]